ncbi:MAG: 16S rRNA (cytosine(967)-C(5))-methyltransferase RsmB [Deltaproteobacteria bacterium]|nr:16S rRNA (cytosine(967)-C(5))-methyltransferase RsmB [Deltaproteobacteria bacterium]
MKKSVRHIAVDILNHVAESDAFAGDLLDVCLDEQNLSQSADGRLLTHLVYGVLRMQGHLDWILTRLYRGDYAKMEEGVKNVLRTGLYQLKFSDRLPAFAVVDEAVKTAKRIAPAAGGLTNAVLRSYLRNTDKIVFPAAQKNPTEHIAAFYSHPLWLVKLWLNIFGPEETIALCRADNELPPLTLRVNTLKISRPAFTERLQSEDFNGDPTRFSEDGITLHDPPRPIQKTFFFRDGLMRIQDEGAQVISYLVNPRGGETILDACAGSGGKTGHLAALMKNEGRIVALDRDADKIGELKKESRRIGASIIEARVADLAGPLPSDFAGAFDRVLVDAPCSGTGTLARNPEIKWRLKSGDIQSLAATQKAVLRNAAGAVKKGGCLIYCTCSLLPAENEDIVREFLAEAPHFAVEARHPAVSGTLLDPRGFFRTYPHRHMMDGFFGAVLLNRN